MGKKVLAELVKKEMLIEGIYKFSVRSKEIADVAKAGQFLEIKVSNDIEPLLRRPISIYNVDKENGIVEFVFQVRGRGTEILKDRREGELIDILGPLGNGNFTVKEYDNVAIIGGGIGTYPLYELAKSLKGKAKKVTMYMGFRNKDLVTLEKEFTDVVDELVLTTDDGSYMKKGYAIDYLKEDHEKNNFDVIFACGPTPMLKAVKAFGEEKSIYTEISLEERMGCGVGACLGCATKILTEDGFKYGHVCKDGPVFDATRVEL